MANRNKLSCLSSMIMMVVPARQSSGQSSTNQRRHHHHHLEAIARLCSHICIHIQLGEFVCAPVGSRVFVCVSDETVCDFIIGSLFHSTTQCREFKCSGHQCRGNIMPNRPFIVILIHCVIQFNHFFQITVSSGSFFSVFTMNMNLTQCHPFNPPFLTSLTLTSP